MSNLLNHSFKVIWSIAKSTLVEVSENIKTSGKSKSLARHQRNVAIAALLISGVGIASPPAPNQLPTGGSVSVGSASINTTGSTMNITQTSNRAAINWTGFDIGPQATVNFIQPNTSSVALNRVNSPNPTQIYGNLNANGQVFLINPSGVYFAPGANVNVGSIVATTHQMSDIDFANSSTTFSRNGSTGSVINDGNIKATIGGYIALLAPEVRNNGILFAQLGTVALASGEAITLNFGPLSKLESLTVTPSQINTLVENRYAVQASGGLIILSAKALNQLAGSVINSGMLEANGVYQNGGQITLQASSSINHSGSMSVNAAPNTQGNGGTVSIIADPFIPNSNTLVNGTISAQGGSLGGNGGNVETSANHVQLGEHASINTTASHGSSGTWTIDPTDFTIAASGGDTTGVTVSNNLATTNVNILSSQGSTGILGNINVNDAVAWSSNHSLTLNAQNNIYINSTITAAGINASLALVYGQGAINAGNTSNYFVNAPINLPNGNHFSTQLGSDGVSTNYTVINSLGSSGSTSGTDLQGINGALGTNFALGSNIDASATSTWNTGSGFTPPWIFNNAICRQL